MAQELVWQRLQDNGIYRWPYVSEAWGARRPVDVRIAPAGVETPKVRSNPWAFMCGGVRKAGMRVFYEKEE